MYYPVFRLCQYVLQFIAGNVEDNDVICQLADDFYLKSTFFHISVGFYPFKSVRDFSLLLFIICKRQFFVSGQIFFNRAIKHRKCTLPEFFRLYYMSDIKVSDNSHE